MSSLLLAAALVASSLSDGGPRRLGVDLVGDDAAQCLSSDQLRARIASTLVIEVGAPGEGAPAAVDLRVSAAREHGGWSASIELVGRRGSTRGRALSIEQDSCVEMANAVVLISALLFDDLWAEEQTREQQSSPPPRPLVLAEPPPPPPPPRWRSFAGVSGALSVGDLPGATGGVALSIEWAAPRVLGVGVSAMAWPRAVIRNAEAPGARFAAFDAAASICARVLERGRVWLAPCAGARGGVAHATGLGLDLSEAVVRPRVWVDAVFGGRARLTDPLWLHFGVGIAVPAIRDRFIYLDAAGEPVPLHRAWPVVPIARLGLELASTLDARRRRSAPSPR